MTRPLLIPALAALGMCLLGCAAPCEKVASSHTAFRKATLPPRAGAKPTLSDGQAHISVSLPYELIDTMIAKQLGRIPVVEVPVPAIQGVSLGKLRLGVEAIRARSAPAGEIGVRVVVGLREGTRSVFTVDVDARLRPHIDPNGGSVAFRLSGRDIIELEPSVSAKSRKQLGDWIWSQLPPAVKMVLDRGAVSSLAGDLAEQLMREAKRKLERELLDSLGELVHFEFDLPEELPVAAIELNAGERNLELELRTQLQVEHGLTPSPNLDRVAGIHPNMVQVRISGDTAAALANNAIREGRIPQRWTLEGEPDPKGDIFAGLSWAEGRRDALEIHLWKTEDDCAHVVLRGEPHLEVSGPTLELGTEQAKADVRIGSLKIRAGLFFSKTARRGIALVESTTAATEIELGTTTMNASVAAATVANDEIVLGLRLSPARPSR